MPNRLIQLHEDVPGERLRLQNADPPVAPRGKRVGCLGVVLGLLAVVAVVEYAILDEGDFLPNLLFLLGIGAVAAVVLLVRLRRLLSLQVDRTRGCVELVQGIPGEVAPEPSAIECAAIESISLNVRHGANRDGRLTLPVVLTLRGNRGRELLAEPVHVAGVNRDVEVLDLVVRLGHAAGLTHYHVARRDPRRFFVEATRVANERSEPMPPSIDEAADYASDRVLPGLVLPDQVLDHFEPSRPLPKGLRITDWKPGRSIAIRPRGVILRWVAGLTSAAAAAACAWGWRHPEHLPLWRDDAWVWLVAAAGFALLATHLARSGSYRSSLDLDSGRIHIRHGLRSRQIGVSRVQEVVLSCHVKWGRVSTDDRPGSNTFYTYRLELRGGKEDTLLLLPEITTTVDERQKAYFDALHPLSVALASQLAKPHRYVETREAAKP